MPLRLVHQESRRQSEATVRVDNTRTRCEPKVNARFASWLQLLAFNPKRASFAATAGNLLDGGDRSGLQEEEVADLIECPLDVLRTPMNFF